MVFVGLEQGARAAHLWDPETSCILVSGDILCRDGVFPAKLTTGVGDHDGSPSHVSLFLPSYPDAPSLSTLPALDHQDDTHVPRGETAAPLTNGPCESITEDPLGLPESCPAINERWSERTQTPIVQYGFSATDHASPEHDHPTHSRAMKGPERAAWKQACQEELDSLLQHNVGSLVDAPPNANILGGMWWLSRKRDGHNRIVRYKARWVAFGNHQIKGLDYEETYASVGSVNSLRILMAMVVGTDWIVWKFDIVTAFLNGTVLEDVYIQQVKDFEHPTHLHHFWELNQSLYGKNQAARCWQLDFNSSVEKFNPHRYMVL